MIRAILCDLGNVLLYFSHERMIAQLAETLAVPTDRVKAALFEGGLLERYETGNARRLELVAALNRLTATPASETALARAANDIFRPNESIEPVVERIAESGIPLVLVSNTSELHIEWVDARFPVMRHFRRRALSFEVGATKPNARIFEVAVALAGCAPAECFFCDDIARYVTAARQFGIDAELYVDTPALLRHLAARGIAID